MNHYNLSPKQLEEKSMNLLKQFDPERLTKAKPLDVYAVIEKCLDVPYDWKYLTPDQSILGMTAFKAGILQVWPEPYYEEGMLPTKIYVEEGTILIDSTLTELPERGAENFTVMHEVFHHVLHKRCFRHSNPDYTHCTTKDALNNGRIPKGFAQGLADRLGVTVKAPTDYLWTDENGRYFVAAGKKVNDKLVPILSKPGKFKTYKPHRRKKK